MISTAGKPRNKIHIGSYTVDVLILAVLAAFCVVIIYPFLNIIAISLSSSRMITRGAVGLIPKELNAEGYRIVFSRGTIYTSYIWTTWYAVLSTLFNVVITSMIAYPLSISDFKLKKPISVMLLITIFFSGGMIPSYLLVKSLGLMNTTWALVLPGCVSAYNVFLYRAFFKGISSEIREAALIDGAGELRILVRIVAPLSKALFATFALFAFVGMWNSYMSALLYIKDSARQPIQMILRSIVFQTGALTATFNDAANMLNNGTLNPLNVQYACLIATIAPLMVIYPFIQKYFEQGMQIGAVKG